MLDKYLNLYVESNIYTNKMKNVDFFEIDEYYLAELPDDSSYRYHRVSLVSHY